MPMAALQHDTADNPPIPTGVDGARWDWTRLGWRLLYGEWAPDLAKRLHQAIGHIRKEAWGLPDKGRNTSRNVWDSLAKIYDVAPAVGHPEPAAQELLDKVSEAGLWPLMQRVSRDVLGLREGLVRVDVFSDAAGVRSLSYRPVRPDLVTAKANPDRPGEPVQIREARLRTRPDTGQRVWCWDELDISDPAHPTYRVLKAKRGGSHEEDLTHLFLEGPQSGEAYPYRDRSGVAVLPYVLYHAAKTGQLWDAYFTRELVDGTLTIAVWRTFLGHVVGSASWPQRWGVDVELPGAAYTDEDGDGAGRSAILTDPATILLFKSMKDKQPQMGQWATSADVEALSQVIANEERGLVASAGVVSADALRVAGDPRSGFAVSVSRDGQREAQRRWEPQFRAGDLALLRLSAILLNRATGSTYPESGYTIAYQGIPLSPEERRALREDVMALVEAGMLDRVSGYQRLHPGLSRAQAMLELEQIDRINNPERGRADPAHLTAALGLIVEIRAGNLTRTMAAGMLAQFLSLAPEAAESILADVDSLPPIEDRRNAAEV